MVCKSLIQIKYTVDIFASLIIFCSSQASKQMIGKDIVRMLLKIQSTFDYLVCAVENILRAYIFIILIGIFLALHNNNN